MDPEINASHKQPLSAEQRKRNELERVVGSGKRKYAPKLNMARLVKGAETSISMASLVMCAEKIRSLLCLFLAVYQPGSTLGRGPTQFGWYLRPFGGLKQLNL